MVFEQNMPESSQSDGRLVKRKHTLGLRTAIMSLGVYLGVCLVGFVDLWVYRAVLWTHVAADR